MINYIMAGVILLSVLVGVGVGFYMAFRIAQEFLRGLGVYGK